MNRFLRILGMALCILPPTVATLEFFPLWLTREDCRLSALSVMLLLIAAIPLFRVVRARLRSPSAWMVWLTIWVLLALLEPIVASIKTIALISFPTGILGAICLRLSEKKEKSS